MDASTEQSADLGKGFGFWSSVIRFLVCPSCVDCKFCSAYHGIEQTCIDERMDPTEPVVLARLSHDGMAGTEVKMMTG